MLSCIYTIPKYRLYPPLCGRAGTITMKEGIHPAYHQITVSCGSCGNSFEVGSTLKDNYRVEICAQCHPLYTGKANLIDTAGRLERFKNRQQKAVKLQGKTA